MNAFYRQRQKGSEEPHTKELRTVDTLYLTFLVQQPPAREAAGYLECDQGALLVLFHLSLNLNSSFWQLAARLNSVV